MSEIKKTKTVAIIPSGGSGKRMRATTTEAGRGKNYMPLLGKSVLAHTLLIFEASAEIDAIIVVLPEGDEEYVRTEIIGPLSIKKVARIVRGGKERQDSVRAGLDALPEGTGLVAVHDGARALVTGQVLERTVKAARVSGAAICGVPVKDTIKEVLDGRVKRTVKREKLSAIQTPQVFKAEILLDAYREAEKDGFIGTDCSSLVERTGAVVSVVDGDYENIKITTAEDLITADRILARREKLNPQATE